MLFLSKLSVAIQDKKIIQNCSIQFQSGKIHVLMGPNGSGKSSLAATIMGDDRYEIVQGSIVFQDIDISTMSVHERARLGIFLGMQHPVEIQGLQVLHFLKEIYSIAQGRIVPIAELLQKIQPLCELVGLSETILQRCVNVGFSGGEKKRFELLQMLLLAPRLAILDEIDSGVDIDGLKHLAQGLQWYHAQYPKSTIILVTHYRHILEYVQPDFVHVMINGTIIATGNLSLLDHTMQHGYSQYAKRS